MEEAGGGRTTYENKMKCDDCSGERGGRKRHGNIPDWSTALRKFWPGWEYSILEPTSPVRRVLHFVEIRLSMSTCWLGATSENHGHSTYVLRGLTGWGRNIGW